MIRYDDYYGNFDVFFKTIAEYQANEGMPEASTLPDLSDEGLSSLARKMVVEASQLQTTNPHLAMAKLEMAQGLCDIITGQ